MRATALFSLSTACLAACVAAPENNRTVVTAFVAAPCDVGIYGTPDTFVALTHRADDYRYSFSDGRAGSIETDSIVECGEEAVRIDGDTVWPRRPIKVTDTRFESAGKTLAGQLLEPVDADAETPLVVLAHGSEELGWIEAVSYPYQFVGRGVSVFVYDKRGTGQSEGSYSQNFPQLADDMVAASAEAKRLAGDRFGRFGLFGFSQGGWIAPLAADRVGAEFIGIGYGLVVDILEEDASQVQLELEEAGYGPDIIAKGKQITDVTARLAVSNYQDGVEDLRALQQAYGDEAWFQNIRGGFTGVLLGMSPDDLRDNGIPMFDRLNIDWSIKPMDILRDVDVPQLWVLAEMDREAPTEKTRERLQQLRDEGKDITIYQFPNTDHGMWEFEQADDGSRTTTRVTDRYYDLLADWARNDVKPPYAESTQK